MAVNSFPAGYMNSPLTLILWKEFQQNPSIIYGMFTTVNQGGTTSVRYDPNRVIFLNETDEDKEPRVFYANTIDELIYVRNELLTKALVWYTEIVHRSTNNYYVVRVTTNHIGQFAVLLNPRHPRIAEPLTQAIDQALEHILKEEKYCIELDIGPSLESWYLDKIQTDGCYGKTRTKNTRIYITNYSKYSHFFDCSQLWCLCLPCCLLSAPCYLGHRSCKVRDISLELGQLPITWRMTVTPRSTVLNVLPGNQIVVTQQPHAAEGAANHGYQFRDGQPLPPEYSQRLAHPQQQNVAPAVPPPDYQPSPYIGPPPSQAYNTRDEPGEQPPSYTESVGNRPAVHMNQHLLN